MLQVTDGGVNEMNRLRQQTAAAHGLHRTGSEYDNSHKLREIKPVLDLRGISLC